MWLGYSELIKKKNIYYCSLLFGQPFLMMSFDLILSLPATVQMAVCIAFFRDFVHHFR